MVKLSMEHILLFVVLAFLLYHLLGNCGYINGVVNGFSVGFDSDVHNELISYGSYICDTIDTNYKDDIIKKSKCSDAGCYFAKNPGRTSLCFFDARVLKYKKPEN